MSYNFMECNREQLFLLPPDIRSWLPEDHLAWFVLDTVTQMDIRCFYESYREDGKGHAAYHPQMMVSLLLYAYCLGERSSRRIEKLCGQDVAFRVIAANQHPDHATIARFRREQLTQLEQLFMEVLKLCREAKLLKLGLVALDGTKLAGNAALAANRTQESLAAEVQKMLREAEETDTREDAQYGAERRGDELPEELRERRSRLARLRECKQRLEQAAAAERAAQERKLAERAEEEAATGEKKRGRKPLPPEAVVSAEAKANVTDPDSRIMKTRSGYVQGYNAQAVATEDQLVIAAEVTQQENDVQQLTPMLTAAQQNLQAVGAGHPLKTATMDAGYFSETNMAGADQNGPELLIATKKDWKQRQAISETKPPCGRIGHGLSLKALMERKLLTKRGKALYAKRKIIIEPIFGQIKDGRGIRRFILRGFTAVRAEWKLICATHNLLKLFRSGKFRLA